MDTLTTQFTVTGQYRDNGRFALNFRLTPDLKSEFFGTLAADPTYGVYATEQSAKRVIDRLTKSQAKTGFIDWTELRVETVAQ